MTARNVVADAANIHLVLARDAVRRGIELGVGIVLDDHARGFPENQARIGCADLVPGFDEHGFAVADGHWDAHARGSDVQRRVVENLAGLGDQLHLLFVVTVGIGLPSTGDDVVGKLVRGRIHLRGFRGGDCVGLALELIQQRAPRTRRRLVGRDDNAPNRRAPAQGIEDHRQRDGGAVWAGDDAFVVANVAAVHLGNHQRHVRLHPPSGALVDDQRTCFGSDRRIEQRYVRACREHRDIDALEGVVAEAADGQLVAVVCDLAADRPLRRDRADAGHGESALRQDLQHLLTDQTRRADDGNV